MDKIKSYFKLQKELHEYFGYKENWTVFPMVDHTDVWWSLTDDTQDIVYSIIPPGHPDAGKSISGEYDKSIYFTYTKDISLKLIEHGWNWYKAGVGDKCHSNEIYHQRFLPTAIYKGEEYTMILVDTHTDNNKYFMVLDNKKKLDKKSIRKEKIKKIEK